MRIAEVIGKLTLSAWHPSLTGSAWRVAVALDQRGVAGEKAGRGEPFVFLDELSVPDGARIAVTEGPEASAPFHPQFKPIDAYNAAILDHVQVV